jgi:hypothetical protein
MTKDDSTMTSPIGDVSQLIATKTNGISFATLSNSEKIAAASWQAVRELFPVANTESDYSVRLRLKLMAQIVEEVGQDRFMLAIEKAISISQRRYDVSIQRIRECAGLRYTPPPTPVSLAWEFVTRVFVDHIRTDENGNYRLEDKFFMQDGLVHTIPAPEIPPAIKRAIQCLGGWAAIAEAWPEYIGQKYGQFKEFYREDDTSPRVDQGTGLKPIK